MAEIVLPISAVTEIQKETARREEEHRKAEAQKKSDQGAQNKGEPEIKKFKEAVNAEALDWLISTKPDSYVQTMMLMGTKGAEAVNAAHAADVAQQKSSSTSTEKPKLSSLATAFVTAVKAAIRGEHELEEEAAKVGVRLTQAAGKLKGMLNEPKREIKEIPVWIATRIRKRRDAE